MKKNIQQEVQKKYGEIAASSGSCCGPKQTCGCSAPSAEDLSASVGYSAADLASIPEGANLGLGCGNPVALASLKAGETVLDLGSGGGIDCFLAARRVGPKGRVIGVDMTAEMIHLARENAQKGDLKNVEFRLGEIENLPVADGAIDVAIPNCVINLSTDKDRVLAEAFRVLRPGGRFAVSDVLFQGDMGRVPQSLLDNVEAWAGCVAGALEERDYLARLRRAGFADAAVEVTNVYDGAPENSCCGAPELPNGVRLISGFVRAVKPAD